MKSSVRQKKMYIHHNALANYETTTHKLTVANATANSKEATLSNLIKHNDDHSRIFHTVLSFFQRPNHAIQEKKKKKKKL